VNKGRILMMPEPGLKKAPSMGIACSRINELPELSLSNSSSGSMRLPSSIVA
jgi:hypothetical protein